MAIKAVFFDIDGTFLNDRKRVSSSTKKAITQMKEDGILVGLATGRGPGFVQPFMDNLGLDFAVTYNGQYILTHDKVLYQNQLPKSTVYNLIRYATKHRREISLGTSTGLVGSNIISMGTSKFGQIVSHIVPKSWAKMVERSFKSLIRRFKPQSIETLKTIMREPIYQVVMVATVGETQDIEEKFPHVKITRSSPYSADIISADQSKLKGIAHLGEFFGFELSEVMAFGDSENDLEMLSGVGVGVAMGNGEDELKDQATHVTDTNNQNGIAKALSHYGLIHFETELLICLVFTVLRKLVTVRTSSWKKLSNSFTLHQVGTSVSLVRLSWICMLLLIRQPSKLVLKSIQNQLWLVRWML